VQAPRADSMRRCSCACALLYTLDSPARPPAARARARMPQHAPFARGECSGHA
jgi:hypothetical protein